MERRQDLLVVVRERAGYGVKWKLLGGAKSFDEGFMAEERAERGKVLEDPIEQS